jgi:diacylglycerol kinase (ATP)
MARATDIEAHDREHAKTLAEIVKEQEAYAPEQVRDNIPEGTRVRVIVNPVSGKKGGLTTNPAGVDEVRAVLDAIGIHAEVVQTEYAGHATELASAARDEGYDIVVACGGDGTVGEVATALIGSQVTLGILPLGSANNVARMMHVPFQLEEAARLLRLGEVRRVDVGRCNGHYFLETAGVGLDAALFPILNKVDKGEYTRLIDVVRTFFKFRPRRVTILLDRRAIRTRALVVLAANGPYWGYSVPLAPDARIDDGKLNVVVFRNFRKRAFLWHVLRSLLNRGADPDLQSGHGRNRPVYHPDIKTYLARRVRVLTRGRPWPVHADAQPRGYTPAVIEVVPAALRVITGPGEHATTTPSAGVPRGEPPKHRLREE